MKTLLLRFSRWLGVKLGLVQPNRIKHLTVSASEISADTRTWKRKRRYWLKELYRYFRRSGFSAGYSRRYARVHLDARIHRLQHE